MKRKTLKQIQEELKKSSYKKRDRNIEAHIKGEISLSNRVVKSKKIYSRSKYKRGEYDLRYL